MNEEEPERPGSHADGGETRNSRLQVFLSSLFSSHGGIFGSGFRQGEDPDMASRAAVLHEMTRGEIKQKNVAAERKVAVERSWQREKQKNIQL